MNDVLDRLQAVENRYEKLNELLSDPAIISDSNKLREYSKEQSDIQETVEVYREYKDVREQLKDAKAMLEDKLDAEMREMVKEEVSELESQEKTLSERLKILLVPKILTMIRTLSLRFVELPVVTRLLYLLVIYTVCIAVTLRYKVGKRRLSRLAIQS